ncbi:MAG: acyltransferase family protein [Pseudomonadota bacterium]
MHIWSGVLSPAPGHQSAYSSNRETGIDYPGMKLGDVAVKFRYDINGLRAWAVIAVVLYHFQVPGFASGFVGVDIFFVISGYLMTRIIIEGYETSFAERTRFRLLNFYLSRARRIIPTLALFGTVMLVIGWLIFTPKEYRNLAVEALFALTFTSNYKYWITAEADGAGYFANEETLRWFLHSWSLSVEWQFYVLLPIIIGLLWKIRRSRKFLGGALAALALFSFAASVVEVHRDAELAFYSIHTRAWQMLAGGLVFFMPTQVPLKRNWAFSLETLGFCLILLSVFWDHPKQEWPGYRALLPVTGTVLVLLMNRQNSVWTKPKLAQYLGKISYSAYLWHWPIVLGLEFAGALGSIGGTLAGLGATVAVASLSFNFSEKPARTWIGRRKLWTGLVIASTMALLPASFGGLVRFTPNFETLQTRMLSPVFLNAADDFNPRRRDCHKTGAVPGPVCAFGGPTVAAIALGDSHSISIVGAIQASLPHENLGVVSLSSSGCETLANAKSTSPEFRCDEYNKWALQEIERFPRWIPIIITNRSTGNLFGYNEDPPEQQTPKLRYDNVQQGEPRSTLLDKYRADKTALLCELAQSRPTYVLLPIPEMGRNIATLVSRRARLGLSTDSGIDKAAYDVRHEFIRGTMTNIESECDVHLLDPAKYLCDEQICWGSRKRQVLYFDDDHLSESGNRLLIPMFEEVWNRHPNTNPLLD